MARFVDIDTLITEVLPCFSKGTIYNYVSEGKIPYVKKGGKLSFDVEKIVGWMREDARGVVVSSFKDAPPWER